MRASSKRAGPRISPAGRVQGLLLALLAVYRPAGSLECRNWTSYQDCRTHPDGVQDLECFGKYSFGKEYFCTWKPGRGPSEKTYDLAIQYAAHPSRMKCYYGLEVTKDRVRLNKGNVSVEVFERSSSRVCTKALFQGSRPNLMRCGPPGGVIFARRGGGMTVKVSWPSFEVEKITHFSVKHKAQGSSVWMESRSKNVTAGAVEGLDPSLAYTAQLSCVSNVDCPQCPWGPPHHIPPELTAAPDLVHLEDTDVSEPRGRRRVSLTWKSPDVHDGYHVTVAKATGELPRERFRTTEPRITLVLSYSAYQLEISAFNNASTSPPLRCAVEEQLGRGAEEPGVTVLGPRSLDISWRGEWAGQHVCYCAEWSAAGRRAASMSFYSKGSSRTLTFKDTFESLEPYRRYTLTLHVRPDRDTCNMKHINNSESTYGTTQFYLLEGPPAGAPVNVSSDKVMLDSAVLSWSSIPEEDTRGFLLGYVLYYSEYQQGTRAEENVTVSPDVNTHKLELLKSGTLYEVQISGFTRAGVGVRSEARAFTTHSHESSRLIELLKGLGIVTIALIVGFLITKRAKQILWPSIPDPKKSNTMQKMEMTNELELLQSISTLKVVEWDADSLHIVQKEHVFASAALLGVSEDELGDAREQDAPVRAAPVALAGGYTTMEMFQKAAVPPPLGREGEPEATAGRSPLDYVRQFSTDSGWEFQ